MIIQIGVCGHVLPIRLASGWIPWNLGPFWLLPFTPHGQIPVPASSEKCTKFAQCEAGLVHSKYVGVDWTARTPYVNSKEAIQPVVRQTHAQERYSASSTQCTFSCTVARCERQWHAVCLLPYPARHSSTCTVRLLAF